jgi:glycosyltransferase involved in cell wall biosynthesis
VANSKNVHNRIEKYYRRDSSVIYPPVEIPEISRVQKEIYYLVISRIVGGKGLDLAVKTAVRLGINLKIAGSPAGYYTEYKKLQKLSKNNVEFLGQVDDNEMAKLYAGAKAFLALSEDEDFGMTPVESMLSGTPVIAFRGGGYLESVIENKTGIFFDQANVESLSEAIRKFEKMKFKPEDCINQAKKFSKERFKREMREFVNTHRRITSGR